MTDAGLKPRKIGHVAVLGGGLMGSGIATALVLAGVNVTLKEVNQQFLDVSRADAGARAAAMCWPARRWSRPQRRCRPCAPPAHSALVSHSLSLFSLSFSRLSPPQSGLGRIKSNLASRVRKGAMSQAAADAALGRAAGALTYNGFGERAPLLLARQPRVVHAVAALRNARAATPHIPAAPAHAFARARAADACTPRAPAGNARAPSRPS